MSLAVVGTDTGVGKTVVTAGLVGWLRETGVDARAVKPAQTGFPPDDDAAFVADVCGDEAAATCLRKLEPALAPAVAADREGVELSYEAIREDCERALGDAECGVLEGIGGLRVPLTADREVVDLVADLGLPTIVVARSDLGTLNHTTLTVEALRNRDVSVEGIVLNRYAGETVAERTNPDVLAEMTDLPVHILPHLDVEEDETIVETVADELPSSLLPETIATRVENR